MSDKLELALEHLDENVVVTSKGVSADKKAIAKAYQCLSDALEYNLATKFKVRKIIRLLEGKRKPFRTLSAIKAKSLMREWLKENKGVAV